MDQLWVLTPLLGTQGPLASWWGQPAIYQGQAEFGSCYVNGWGDQVPGPPLLPLPTARPRHQGPAGVTLGAVRGTLVSEIIPCRFPCSSLCFQHRSDHRPVSRSSNAKGRSSGKPGGDFKVAQTGSSYVSSTLLIRDYWNSDFLQLPEIRPLV